MMRNRWGRAGLLALALAAGGASAQEATPAVPGYQLDMAASATLQWPLERWQLSAQDIERDLRAELESDAPMKDAQRRERYSWMAQLAQLRGDWPAARDWWRKARALHESELGRQTAGLLNELLVEQQLAQQDEAALSKSVYERFATLPWTLVEGVVRNLRKGIAGLSAESTEAFLTRRVDVSTAFTKGRVNQALYMQILGARLQLAQVLPHREALLAGLDGLLAEHPAEPPQGAASS